MKTKKGGCLAYRVTSQTTTKDALIAKSLTLRLKHDFDLYHISNARKNSRSTKAQKAKIDTLILKKLTKVLSVASHPKIIGTIDFIWGKPGNPKKNYKTGFGIAKIILKHGIKDLYNLPDTISNGKIFSKSENRIIIDNREMRAVISLGKKESHWLLTGYTKTK